MQEWSHKTQKFTFEEYRPYNIYRGSNNEVFFFFFPTKEECTGCRPMEEIFTKYVPPPVANVLPLTSKVHTLEQCRPPNRKSIQYPSSSSANQTTHGLWACERNAISSTYTEPDGTYPISWYLWLLLLFSIIALLGPVYSYHAKQL